MSFGFPPRNLMLIHHNDLSFFEKSNGKNVGATTSCSYRKDRGSNYRISSSSHPPLLGLWFWSNTVTRFSSIVHVTMLATAKLVPYLRGHGSCNLKIKAF